jgi:hypothetical protein
VRGTIHRSPGGRPMFRMVPGESLVETHIEGWRTKR